LVNLLHDDKINSDSNDFLEKKSQEIKNKITSLQFVQNCSNVKKLVCGVEQNCGYACQIHFLLFCFVHAYYQNRTVIFKDLDPTNESDKKRLWGTNIISNLNRLNESFLPFSNCSINANEIVVDILGKYVTIAIKFLYNKNPLSS